jgi:hypothetical protein
MPKCRTKTVDQQVFNVVVFTTGHAEIVLVGWMFDDNHVWFPRDENRETATQLMAENFTSFDGPNDHPNIPVRLFQLLEPPLESQKNIGNWCT